jgi:hypothetical protein
MAKQYFSNFPLIEYNGVVLRNIILKSNITKDILLGQTLFYTYEVKDGEKPSMVAYNYYGSVDYTWLVMLSNQMVDPYFDWILSNEEFQQFIITKYGSVAAAQALVVEYADSVSDERYSLNTFNYVFEGDDLDGWLVPIYAYDKEFELNEQNRNIRLIDRRFSKQISLELERSLRG